MRAVFVLFEPFHEVEHVSAVPALPAFEQALASQHLLTANLANSSPLCHVFPVTDALLCHVHALQECPRPLRRPPLVLLDATAVDPPFAILEPFEFAVLSRKFQGLPELHAVFSQAGELVCEPCDGLQVEILVEVGFADELYALFLHFRQWS